MLFRNPDGNLINIYSELALELLPRTFRPWPSSTKTCYRWRPPAQKILLNCEPTAQFLRSVANEVSKFNAGAAIAVANRSMILEFEVADVDSERMRLQGLIKDWVLEPTTQPWGFRSMLFRDPDGKSGSISAARRAPMLRLGQY